MPPANGEAPVTGRSGAMTAELAVRISAAVHGAKRLPGAGGGGGGGSGVPAEATAPGPLTFPPAPVNRPPGACRFTLPRIPGVGPGPAGRRSSG
ncbi:hypothetical protein GCM10027091_14630 [Streptomyces daliensis]